MISSEDQFHTISDLKLRKYLVKFADFIDEKARDEIIKTYEDDNLASAYRAWRNFNDLDNRGYTKKKTMREIVRIPAGYVYHFLKSTFEPHYGRNWLSNKKVLNHELVRPFWLVSNI